MSAALIAMLLSYTYADEGARLDHRGQPSIFAAPVLEVLATTVARDARTAGLGMLAVGFPVNDEGGTAMFGLAAGADRAGARVAAPMLAYRGYFGGDEPWKSFFEAGVMMRVKPALAGVLRLGAGVQLDVSEHAGLYLGGGVGLGGGDGLHLSGDVALGVQVRFGPAHSDR